MNNNDNDNFVDDKRNLEDWLKNVNLLLLLTLIIFIFFLVYSVYLFSIKKFNNI